MANRNYNPAQNREKEIISLFAEVGIGATGAPTITKSLDLASIVRNGAGNYTATLKDPYIRLMNFSVSLQSATSEDLTFQLISHDESTKAYVFSCKAAAVETDPSDGATLFLKWDVKRSSVGE